MSNFFIMMETQKGDKILPLVDDFDDPVLFETEEEAHRCAKEHDFCVAFGYEVFERGTGSCC